MRAALEGVPHCQKFNEAQGAWEPEEHEIDGAAEQASLLRAFGKAPAQPAPQPNPILFHPDLVDREFGSYLLSVPKLTEWAAKQGLEVVTHPPIGGFQFVQVEAFLCAIERAARESTRDEQQAAAIIQATPHLAHDRAAEVAPRWLVGADAHLQWRRLLEKAVEAGELALLHFGSKLPIEARTEPLTAPVVVGSAEDGEAWKAKARERADEIIKRQRAKDLHPSQEDIADEIAREFRADGVMGAGGKPLTGAYVKRHALKGISSAQNRQLSTSIRRGK